MSFVAEKFHRTSSGFNADTAHVNWLLDEDNCICMEDQIMSGKVCASEYPRGDIDFVVVETCPRVCMCVDLTLTCVHTGTCTHAFYPYLPSIYSAVFLFCGVRNRVSVRLCSITSPSSIKIHSSLARRA